MNYSIKFFKKIVTYFVCMVLLFCLNLMQLSTLLAQTKTKPVLVIHGGAGTILKQNISAEKELAYREKLNEALQKGYAVLTSGGTSIDAVETAIKVLENSPLFNAGKGAVFTNDGKNEMDAAIMDGSNLKAGSIAGVRTIKNPIVAARAVMEKSEHVMMIGVGAENFAKLNNIELVDTAYFFEQSRWDQLQKIKATEKLKLEHGDSSGLNPIYNDYKYGTVGAVALDSYGNLAAGTSTGGMTNKRFGRVGDCPIIGAGTYANNQTCAVSATGHGEYFMRALVAYDVSALIEYKNLSIAKAANRVVMQKLVKLGGAGGVIALDKNGNFSMPFNTEGMYRGYIDKNGNAKVFIYKTE